MSKRVFQILHYTIGNVPEMSRKKQLIRALKVVYNIIATVRYTLITHYPKLNVIFARADDKVSGSCRNGLKETLSHFRFMRTRTGAYLKDAP